MKANQPEPCNDPGFWCKAFATAAGMVVVGLGTAGCAALTAGCSAATPITLGGITYDEFADMPFVDCAPEDVMSVVFINTDDPFFYDLRDRRRPRPHTPPHELETALTAAPLDLPPPVVFD